MKKISGVGKRHILKNFFKRINTPYDLRIHDAIDGEEVLHLALTKKSVYILISSILVGSFLIVSLLFLFTPIKYYIPGYETTDSRKKIVFLRNRIDSLEGYQKNYNKLLNNAIAVAADDETFLLDTAQLDNRLLSIAEMANEQEIQTNIGKKRTVGSRPKDTAGSKKSVLSSPIKEVLDNKPSETKKPEKKKWDTVIIYKKL